MTGNGKQILEQAINNHTAQTGNRKTDTAYLTKGPGTGKLIVDLNQRLVFYHQLTSDGQRAVGHAVVSASVSLEFVDDRRYEHTEVDLGYEYGEPDVLKVLRISSSGGVQAGGGLTPQEQSQNASRFPLLQNIADLRVNPIGTASKEVMVSTGNYIDNTGAVKLFSANETSSATNTLTDQIATLSSGEHAVCWIVLDVSTGILDTVLGTPVVAAGSLPSRLEFNSSAAFNGISVGANQRRLVPVYLYFGQTAVTENHFYRAYDSRHPFNAGGSSSGSGTVTSVAVTVPTDVFDETGSPVTTSGTIAITKKSQTANTVAAGPTTGSPAAWAFRALVSADIPSLPYGPDSATYITQTPSGSLSAEQALSLLSTGILKSTTTTGVVSTAAAGTDYTSPTGAENLSNKTITASSLVATALSLLIGGFKAIFTHANTADRTYTLRDETGTLQMQRLTTKGDLLTYDTSDVRLGVGTNNHVLQADSSQSKGIKWALVSLVNSVTGLLGLANGGTGADLSATGFGLVQQVSTGGNLSILSVGATGHYPRSNGTNYVDSAIQVADIPGLPASLITSSQLVLARGGTGADLSATGPGVLIQATNGANVTVTLKYRKPLFDHFADASSTATSAEEDLYSDTLAAGQFATNGDKVFIRYAFTYANTARAKRFRAYVADTTNAVFDTGAILSGTASNGFVDITAIRVSSTVLRIGVTGSVNNNSFNFTNYVNSTGLTLSNTQIVKCTSTVTSGAANDVVAKLGVIEFEGAA